jgi:hypothetical protein
MCETSDLYWSVIAPQRLAATGIDPDQPRRGVAPRRLRSA